MLTLTSITTSDLAPDILNLNVKENMMKDAVFWDVMLYSGTDFSTFHRTCCFHPQDRRVRCMVEPQYNTRRSG